MDWRARWLITGSLWQSISRGIPVAATLRPADKESTPTINSGTPRRVGADFNGRNQSDLPKQGELAKLRK
jgi:hypothetical protein